jgi:hypothetical protein
MTATTQPAWCSLDHTREPADTHAGVIRLGTDLSGLDIFLTHEPGEEGTSLVLVPVGFTDSTDHGLGISLDAELTAELARVLAAA